ncbi:uncharacterized protein LOC126822233 [Patella vulgata]|uniref:uncharacterized protein LOC126822233 n=1 Tax=Patella vulgata TaxID=6465 RepID=UPI0024A89EC5|nr:uncharacterized protein LOC126822233 [Patella vulgata]
MVEVQKILHIGSTIIFKITYDRDQISRIICAVQNTDNNETNFYFLNCTNFWYIDQNQQPPNTELRITIYGLKINEPKVILRNTVIINSPVHHMRLESHNKHGLFPISVATDELKFNVDQSVNEMTNESCIIFKCEDVPLPTRFEFKYHYIQIIQTTSTTNHVSSYNEYVELTPTDNNEIPCVNLPSREAVNYKIYRVSQSGNRYHVTKTSNESNFITHNTMVDVNNLHRLALLANVATTMPVPYLYRNKPSTHLTIREANRTGIMTKYIKDNNGDQASSINEKINGLFFSATADRRTHNPPVRSPFGNYRILVPPQYLLKFNSIPANIYFADFYCKKQGGPHYITLVLTKPGSVEDVYCKPRLLKLDINNNKFLYYDRIHDQYRTDSSSNVEVLYTENINLNEMRSKLGFREVYVLSTGQSRPGGIPKNTSCNICNLPKNPSRILSFCQILGLY